MMKKLTPFLLLFFCSALQLIGQGRFSDGHPGMEFRSLSHGRTTGHVIDLILTNSGHQAVEISLPPFYIPSDGKYQGYITTPPSDPVIEVGPGTTITVPLSGYCSDIHKPPVPAGEPTVPIDEWITPDMTGPGPKPGDELDDAVFKPVVTETEENGQDLAYEPITPGRTTPHVLTTSITYPGTDVPLRHTIDITTHPEEAAPILFDAMDRITQAFDSLQNRDLILTPFSGDLDREKGSVIQQTFWMYTSVLTGEPYAKEDFTDRMEDQFYSATDQQVEDTDSLTSARFYEGVDQFWSTFELVGAEAKVIRIAEGQTTEQITDGQVFHDETTGEEDPLCTCNRCRFDPGSVFQKYKALNGSGRYVAVLNDTISWNYHLKYTPPGIKSDCPADCPVHIEKEFTSSHFREGYDTDVRRWSEGPQIRESFAGPGRIVYSAVFSLHCKEVLCCRDTLVDTLYIVETNDCCDRLRNESGELVLRFGEEKALELDQHALIFHKDGRRIRYTFPMNIEAAFCNLENGEILGEVDRELTGSYASGGTASEAQSASSLIMERGNEADLEAQGIEPHFTFRFMLSGNGQETQFSFSMDKETCKFDISVLHEGELEEFTSGSIYNYGQLSQQVHLLRSIPSSRYWWARMQFLYLQMMKMEDPFFRERCGAMLRQKLLNAISLLLNDETPGGWNTLSAREQAVLQQLRQAIEAGNDVRLIQLLDAGNLPFAGD
jgi:hypothetical protein